VAYTVARKFLHFDIGNGHYEHSRGRLSSTTAKRLELSVYVKVGETLQEEEVEEEAETIVLQEESEEEEQRSGSLGARYVVGGGR